MVRFRPLGIVAVGSIALSVVAAPAGAHPPTIPVAISLNDVAAVSANDVWAVGNGTDSGDPDNTDPAFEHWDGTEWRLVPGERTLEDQEEILGVAAIGPGDVWAVGSVGQRFADDRQIEIQHWDGTEWSFGRPFQASINNILEGVAAASPDDVWAVGSMETGGGSRDRSLVEHWDGRWWGRVPIPDPPGTDFLKEVAVVSPGDVWAVGSTAPPTGKLQPLVMHWNGSQWSLVRVPPLSRDARFTDVVAIGPNDVWAVGSAFEPTIPSISRPLTAHWDGTAWTVVRSPDTGRFNSDQLASVTAIATDDAWSIGNYVDNGEQTLAQHWNGTSWTIAPAPPSFSMNDVVAVASDDVWAVGWMISRSIIEHWNGTRWSVVPSP